MIYGIKLITKYLLGIDHAGRNLLVFPDDRFLVSFFRSGSTWTRFLIANLLRPEKPVTFLDIEQIVPNIMQPSRRLKRMPRPRFLTSHEYFDRRYKRVVYVVRDPRDVVVSQYHFARKSRTVED